MESLDDWDIAWKVNSPIFLLSPHPNSKFERFLKEGGWKRDHDLMQKLGEVGEGEVLRGVW